MNVNGTAAATIPFSSQPRVFRLVLLLLVLLTGTLWLSSRAILSANFLPHWYCFAGNTRVLWTTVIADLFIGLSYVVISATLVFIVRRAGRDLPYQGFFWAFGLFIVSCGVTHFMEILTVWQPLYWLSAASKIITAVASVGTAAVLLLAAGDIIEFVLTARQLAARRGDEKFRALFNAAPLAVLSFDLQGVVTSWNPAAERIFGFAERDVVGQFLPIVPEDLHEEHRKLLKTSLDGSVTTAFETIRQRSDGSQIPVNAYAAPLNDEHGKRIGVVTAIEDISERKRMQLELQTLEAQVRQAQKMEVLGRVAGGVAHDFNNMLMILSGSAELLGRSFPPDALSRVYIDQIQRTVTKAAAITKQLLAFSRKQILDIRAMDLHAALLESRAMLPTLMGADVELHFSASANNHWIRSDAQQIEQVIVNLVINARDAMPEGGKLSITTRDTSAPPAGPLPVDPKDWVVLEVSDTGRGMDQQTLTHIFEPFFTTKPAGKGTGLGLATVYGIVRQSGGHIEVQSEPGNGARFLLYFPTTKALPDVLPRETKLATRPVAASATLLLVDDEAALRQAIAEILRDSGYTVIEAASSQEALGIAREYPGSINLLVTDVVMPGLRGPELHQRILTIHQNIQVLFMSGYAEGLPETQLPASALFLQKPFSFSALLESLRALQSPNGSNR